MRKESLELGQSIGGLVIADEAGGELQLADYRVEGAVLVVRRAKVAQPGVGITPQLSRDRISLASRPMTNRLERSPNAASSA